MKNIGRTIRVGITVGVIFFGWYLHEYYERNWDFKLFSPKHWAFVWNEFKSGWIISATSDWIFALSVLFMGPIFLLLWWGCCKISWRKSLKKVLKGIKSIFVKTTPKKVIQKKVKLKAKGSHKKVRPLPMNSTGRPAPKQTGRTMDADKGPQPQKAPTAPTQNFATPTMTLNQGESTVSNTEETNPFLTEEISNIPLDEIKLPERIRLEENLVELLISSHYQVLQNAKIGNLDLDYIGISADKIILCLTDKEKGDWLADEEFFNEEDPLWFSESSHRVSPVFQLLTQTKEFAKKVKEHNLPQAVIPILIEKEGTIINAPDMMETWKKIGIIVCRTDLGGPEDLLPFGDALPKSDDKGTSEDLDAVRDLL